MLFAQWGYIIAVFKLSSSLGKRNNINTIVENQL